MIITQNAGAVTALGTVTKNEYPPSDLGQEPPITSGAGSALRSEAELPCLNSNISTEISSTQHRKAASALGWNVFWFAQKHGLENLGFLTLTFRDHVLCTKEAQRRLNSLLSHVIKPRYSDYIGVMERQKSGRIHFHLLVHVGFDVRTGFNFDGVAKQDYSSASKDLRAEWAFWRKTAPKYRFGRTELMPIKSTEEAIGKYIGKYIGKHMEARDEADKGARLVRYSRGARTASTRFQFVSDGSAQWRAKVGAFVHYVAARTGCEPSFAGLRQVCGPRWAYNHREFIMALPSGPSGVGAGDTDAQHRAPAPSPVAQAIAPLDSSMNEPPREPEALPLPRSGRFPPNAAASGCKVTEQQSNTPQPPHSNTGVTPPLHPPET